MIDYYFFFTMIHFTQEIVRNNKQVYYIVFDFKKEIQKVDFLPYTQ